MDLKIIFKRTHIQAIADVGLDLSLVMVEAGSVAGVETHVEIQKRNNGSELGIKRKRTSRCDLGSRAWTGCYRIISLLKHTLLEAVFLRVRKQTKSTNLKTEESQQAPEIYKSQVPS